MAKFYGKIGYASMAITAPGVTSEVIKTRKYSGDVTKNYNKVESSEYLNSNVNIRNIISIVADPYALDNIYAMRYIEWMGTRWDVTSIEVLPPRLLISIGGVYNGPEEIVE